ncbi:hypothetical protein OsI_00087 [Oryza sativa Indica Group]|uniref:Uncharacterized protein n=2 Tax=Oryza sativa TaxID=4530 RepID=A2ZNF0_ORYSJ|nr:hypothetical protein OsI_00087 [Oryza sativa Indica Group]EAZ10247.1 hypothetical protein OsJ_00079 [Oryza sativa Japonica Group]
MARANEMVRADSRMMVVFSALASKSGPLTFEDSLRFVKKVKACNYMLYLSLFDILGRMELSRLEAYRELQLLFQNYPDLHEELEKFRPPVPIKHPANNIWPWLFACAVPLVARDIPGNFGFIGHQVGRKEN